MLWKIAGSAIALIIVAVVAVGALMYFRVVPLPGFLLAQVAVTKPPEYTARYFPRDTVTYAWVTAAPGNGQFDDMQEIWELLNEYRVFEDLIEEWKDAFADETGFDFDEDVMPWIGLNFSAGFLDVDDDVPKGAIIISVRNKRDAASFLDDWLDYQEDEHGADFDENTSGDFDTWVDENSRQSYAIAGDWLVFATDEDTLDEVLDRIAGDDERSLASDGDFEAARDALSASRFASVYINTQVAPDIASAEGFDAGEFSDVIPDWVALSAGWVNRGIVMETILPVSAEDFGLEITSLSDPANSLSDDTLGFLAFTYDTDLDNWRDALGEYRIADFTGGDPYILEDFNYQLQQNTRGSVAHLTESSTLDDIIDPGIDLIYDSTGIDVEQDFLDYMGGEAILAVSAFDFYSIMVSPAFIGQQSNQTRDEDTIDMVLMLSYANDAEDDLLDTMEDVTDTIEQYLYISPDEVDVGADEDAVIFPIEFTSYAPGYVLNEGYLIIGSTEDTLETVVELQDGDGDNLSSSERYRRAAGNLPDDRQFIGYVDLQSIFEQLQPDSLGIGDHYRLLEEALGAVAISATDANGYTRVAVALTLFPE